MVKLLVLLELAMLFALRRMQAASEVASALHGDAMGPITARLGLDLRGMELMELTWTARTFPHLRFDLLLGPHAAPHPAMASLSCTAPRCGAFVARPRAQIARPLATRPASKLRVAVRASLVESDATSASVSKRQAILGAAALTIGTFTATGG